MKLGSVADTDEVLTRMAHTSKKLNIFFLVVLGAYAVVNVIAIVAVIADGSAHALTPEYAIGVMPTVVSIVIGGYLIYSLSRMFRDVSEGQSPFTMVQARRVRAIGVMLLVFVAFEALASSAPDVSGRLGSTYFMYSVPSGSHGVFIDVKFLFASIVCFCLSYLFKYGALLQLMSDDTI